jgi:nucleotide-binding universal stress UspA family protein
MRILVPVDGSRAALKALKHACKLMRGFAGLNVTLVSVHDDVALRNARSFVGSKAVDEYLNKLSEKDLDASRKMLDKDAIDYTVEIRTGHVAQEIVQLADSERFDLIVMGNKGRSALRDLLIGSVAQRVLAQAKTPVLLVK